MSVDTTSCGIKKSIARSPNGACIGPGIDHLSNLPETVRIQPFQKFVRFIYQYFQSRNLRSKKAPFRLHIGPGLPFSGSGTCRIRSKQAPIPGHIRKSTNLPPFAKIRIFRVFHFIHQCIPGPDLRCLRWVGWSYWPGDCYEAFTGIRKATSEKEYIFAGIITTPEIFQQ